jgi:hypothetical protein
MQNSSAWQHYPTIEPITWTIFKNLSALMCVFLKLFVHDLLYKFIDAMDLKWCIGHWFTHPVIKKWFSQVNKNIIAISSAELFSAVLYRNLACTRVLYRALACIDVLWRALACSGVHWRTKACSGVHWRALACIGVLWRVLACSGVNRRALACSGVLCYAELKCLTIEIHYPTIEHKKLE